MNKRTIPTVVLGAVLATGLLSACSASTGSDTPAATTSGTATESPAASQSPTASATAAPTESAPASEAPAPVMQPSELTLTATDGKVSGRLVVAGSDQGVADASVSLVFRPDGGGTVQTSSATTDETGAFTATADGASAGTWTASFLGTDAAGSAAATAKVG